MHRDWAMLSPTHLLGWWEYAPNKLLAGSCHRTGWQRPGPGALLCLAEQAGKDAVCANGHEADRVSLADAVAGARAALGTKGPTPELA